MSDGVMPVRLDWMRLDPEVLDANGMQWFLTNCKGFWDSAAPRVDITERFIHHGAYMGPNYFKERIITLEGRAFANDFATLRAAQARVAGICADVNKSFWLTFESEIGNISAEVRLDDATTTQPFEVYTPAFDFSIQLIAPDPRKFSENWHVVAGRLPLQISDSGLNFDATLNFGVGANHGLIFGDDDVTGGARLINRGSAEAAPVLTLHGPLVNPVLSCQDSNGNGYQLKYNGTLNSGDIVVIDPDGPSVLLGGTASRRHLLNPANFSGFKVPPATDTPGVLVIGLSHDGSPSATGWFEAAYRDCWW